MKLSDLLKNIEYKKIIGVIDVNVTLLTQDSRDENIKQGLYFAVPGTQIDGHDFIQKVIEKGVSVIVCEKLPKEINSDSTYIMVDNVRSTMGIMASNFYGQPSSALGIIAVTGTNGKTSIATFAADALNTLGESVLLLSTAGDYFNGQKININRKASSSIEIIELQKTLRRYVDMGATYCCLEATSHALDQYRLSGINIKTGIFTNLTRDHIDYHKTMDHYRDAKKKLFDCLHPDSLAISNFDSADGVYMVSDTLGRKISYGTKPIFDYSFAIESMTIEGTQVILNEKKYLFPLIGEFNVYNIVSVFSLLAELGYNREGIKKSLESISGVPGRLEIISNNKDFLVLVDYAHTPDALENVLLTLKKIPHNKIRTLIGCGGDRDRKKRAPMASIAQKNSDDVIYTSDNPRTESLDQIFQDMKKGINNEKSNFMFIEDREKSIKTIIHNAQPKDIVLIAGKGHEDYQIIGKVKKPFDDREIAKKYLL